MADLIDYVRSAFGLDRATPASLTPGGRGALGQISRLTIGPQRYAVKELFQPGPPDPVLLDAEVDFTRRAAAAGVRVAASHPAADGRIAVPMPTGAGWLRLYDWLDATPLDLAAPDLPARLGTLLGRLHGCAPSADREPDGSPPDPWFDVPPVADVWPDLVIDARAAGVRWATDLAGRVDLIRSITGLARPGEPAAMLTCHRDLHPENVLVVENGELAVVDWDNLGPAEPGRELAKLLLDWFYDNDILAADAARGTLAAYVAAGGPGRLTGADDFGFAIAARLNFLHRQIRVVLDPATEPRHREWAEREIDEALRILPTPAVCATLVSYSARARARATAAGPAASAR